MARSLKKPPFVRTDLIKQISHFNKNNLREVILTTTRSSTIIPTMISHTIAVHNGQEYIPLFITNEMIGHKLGEFSSTRTFRGHVKKDKKVNR